MEVESLLEHVSMVRAFQLSMADDTMLDQLGEWTVGVKKYVKDNQALVTKKAADMMTKAAQKAVSHGVSTFVPISEFDWSAGVKGLFAHGEGSGGKDMISVQVPNSLNLLRSFNAMVGFSGLMVCMEGKLLTTVLPPELLSRLGTGDMQTFLKALPPTSLSKVPTFLLNPGHAVWYPPGHFPISYGYQGSLELTAKVLEDQRVAKSKPTPGLSQCGRCTFVTILNLDLRHGAYGSDVKQILLENACASSLMMPKSIQSWAIYKQYIQAVTGADDGACAVDKDTVGKKGNANPQEL